MRRADSDLEGDLVTKKLRFEVSLAANPGPAAVEEILGKKQAKEREAMNKAPLPENLIIQLQDVEGNFCGQQVQVPSSINHESLRQLLRSFQESELNSADEDAVDILNSTTYAFYLEDHEIRASIAETLRLLPDSLNSVMSELVLPVVFQPQSVFRVQAVTRCTSTLPGHSEAILSVSFSPDGQMVASGSGDKTLRIWDVDVEMPRHVLKGHKDWILAVSWAPNGKRIASGGKDGLVRIWDPIQGVPLPKKPLRGHSKWITSVDWEPLHKNPESNRLVSGSKDGTIRIWDAIRGDTVMTFSGHSHCVTCVRWGGNDLIYSASEDRTIKVWGASSGKLVRILEGHGHWVNSLSINVDYALRTGAFDNYGKVLDKSGASDAQQIALKKYTDLLATSGGQERLVSCSDDFTLFLWEPETSKKPLIRMTGHQRPVNVVKFSPDGKIIASASFDNSVKLWSANGTFLATLRAHVQAVYQLGWSSDSRLLVSGSKDSTMKVWDVKAAVAGGAKVLHKAKSDLPGHADEVYAVDWSPDGKRVASGGKDRLIKFWRR